MTALRAAALAQVLRAFLRAARRFDVVVCRCASVQVCLLAGCAPAQHVDVVLLQDGMLLRRHSSTS